MAQFVIETTKEERERVLSVLKEFEGQVIPVSTIAEKAEMRASRTRYALMDLISSGRIRRVPSKVFNKHYIRYTYEIL